MPELLFEIFSEEIPARFQRSAAQALKTAIANALVANGLTYESAAGFATPRRLCVTVTDIPPASADTIENRKGPRLDAPEKAIEGFLRGAGLKSVEQAIVQSDPKKGDHYLATITKKGRTATEILAEILPKAINDFAWAKPMRWSDKRLQWVRPIRAITATFGTENEEPEVISFEVEGLRSGQTTFGHRFMAPKPIRVRRFSDYQHALEQAKVVLNLDRRMQIIKNDADHLAFAQGLQTISDKALLEEVAGLVEWPVVLLGSFDTRFLKLPEEVIITTIRANQKCFCLRETETKNLSNKFILVANIEAGDGGKTIVAGNERVIGARLSDAMFFYNNDLSSPLEDRLHKLKHVVFHKKLGNQAQRVTRIVKLAGEIAPVVGADVDDAKRAAKLAKADLVTQMVVEFTSLQGVMGRYYAIAQGEKQEIVDAIADHYKPVGPGDIVPTAPVSIAVALADKLDILSGFWAIDEKPTGSRDPFALRRAALGVIRILIENGIRYELIANLTPLFDDVERSNSRDLARDLANFFGDRLKVLLRDKGVGHEIVDAVFALGDLANKHNSDASGARDMLVINNRAIALSGLIKTEAGQSLLAGYRRAANILVAEEKRDNVQFSSEVDTSLFSVDMERTLAAAIETARIAVSNSIDVDDYAGAVSALGELRKPVDQFFETVLINDPDPDVRKNRLNLLARLRDTMHMVADFSKISG